MGSGHGHERSVCEVEECGPISKEGIVEGARKLVVLINSCTVGEGHEKR